MKHIFCLQHEKWIGKWNLPRFTNQKLLQKSYKNTFFPDPPQNLPNPHNPDNHRRISTDTQEETGNTTENPVPY